MHIMSSSAAAADQQGSSGILSLSAPFAKKVTVSNPSGSRNLGTMSCLNSQFIVWVIEEQTSGQTGGRDHLINYANESGVIQKSRKLNDPASSGKIQARQAVSDGLATYMIATVGSNTNEMYVCKTSEDGDTVTWARKFSLSPSFSSEKVCMLTQNTNSIFAIFYDGSPGSGRCNIVQINKSDGIVTWVRRLSNVGIIPFAAVADDTGVYVADRNNTYLVKLDNSGNLSWQTQMEYSSNEINGIAMLDDAIVISGRDPNSSSRMDVLWFDPTSGSLLHSKQIDNTQSSIRNNSASSDIFLLEIDNVGNVDYGIYSLDGSAEKYWDNIIIDPDENFIMFGNTDSATQWIVSVTDDRQIPTRFNQDNDYDGDFSIAEANHVLSTPTNSISTITLSSTPVTLTLDNVTINQTTDWTS